MKIYSSETIKIKLTRRKKIGKVVCACLWVLVAFSLICVGIVICQKFILKRKNVNLFGYTPFIVSSGSMQPSLQVYDIIVVKKVRENKISSGDVITFFDADGDIVTHRISEIFVKDGKNRYITKGDANNANDIYPIEYEDIIGRYSFKIPNGGRFVAAVISPAGIVILALLFAFICFIVIRTGNRKTARHFIREKFENQPADRNRGVLIISQTQNKVILPYGTEEISADDENGNRSETTENRVVPLSRYKCACISRFKEAFALIRKREKGSFFDALGLASELFFIRFLHPSVITACKNQDWLDVYLDCLEQNELDDFPFFEIRYE